MLSPRSKPCQLSVKRWGYKDWSEEVSLIDDEEILKIQLEEEPWHWAAKYGSLAGGAISGGVAVSTYFLAQQAVNDFYKDAGKGAPIAKLDEYSNTLRVMNVLTVAFGVLSGILLPVGLALLIF